MKEVILSGKGITKAFSENTVLHGIDVEIFAGDFTVIMGSSGSGKSTLLYALSAMDRLSSGQLVFRGQDLTDASEKKLTKLRAEDFGFVFQRTHLISNLTLHENIRMAGLIGEMTDEEAKRRTDDLISRMKLEGAKDRLPSQVSGGEAQRAAVARAVINKPTILFADEPTYTYDEEVGFVAQNVRGTYSRDDETTITDVKAGELYLFSGGQLRFYFKDMEGADITATPVGYYTDTEGLAEAVQDAYESNLGDMWGVDVYFWITKTIK